MKKKLLLVVDVQNGFVVNESTERIIPNINGLIEKWRGRKWPVAFSRFVNKPGSAWDKYLNVNDMMSDSEIKLADSLMHNYGKVYDKTAYSAWTDEVRDLYQKSGAKEVVICGIDTDQCVLATAAQVFDQGIKPILAKDCCASSAGPQFHESGLLILKRLIGADQIVNSADL